MSCAGSDRLDRRSQWCKVSKLLFGPELLSGREVRFGVRSEQWRAPASPVA